MSKLVILTILTLFKGNVFIIYLATEESARLVKLLASFYMARRAASSEQRSTKQLRQMVGNQFDDQTQWDTGDFYMPLIEQLPQSVSQLGQFRMANKSCTCTICGTVTNLIDVCVTVTVTRI